MASHYPRVLLLALLVGVGMVGCTPVDRSRTVALVGARVIDGTGRAPIDNAVIIVRDGRILSVGEAARTVIPDDADRVDVAGGYIIPGLINAHGHVGRTATADSGAALAAALKDELEVYAHYGVTTVNSLGGESWEAVGVRDEQDSIPPTRARLYIAGAVVTGQTPAEAREMVEQNVSMRVDMIKIRVDDNLGTTNKMPVPVYQAAIEQAHTRGKRLAAHVFYLNDGKALLRSGADLIAHSVRDQPVDAEFLELLREHDVCYCPTLTREVSTFVYEEVPSFFSDPFFLAHADSVVIRELSDPARQQSVRTSASAQRYKLALAVAKQNVKRVADGGGTIVFGTDTGPYGRFQGYFEHLELELLAESGLTPMQVIVAATGDAARCLELSDLGTIEVGKWADFVVLSEDPLQDIRNARHIMSVWIAGNRVAP